MNKYRAIASTAAVALIAAGCAPHPAAPASQHRRPPMPQSVTVAGVPLTLAPQNNWYAMNDAQGKPQGYARLVVQPIKTGAHIEWELKLGFPDGSYVETRTMTVDQDFRMTAATYDDTEVRIEGARSAGKILVTARQLATGKQKTKEVPITDAAWSGMDFALAPSIQLAEKTVLRYAAINEAAAFEPLGPATFTVKGREEVAVAGKRLTLWRVERTSTQNGKSVTLPIWINDARQIVQVDWGGGNMMVLSDKPTTHLFVPPKPPAGAPK